MVAIKSFHFDIDKKTGEENPHCHVLLSTRELTETGFSRHKQREWDRKELVEEWREQYAQYQNAALKEHGFEVRVDHRSNKDRGLHEVDAQPKRGKAIVQMTERGQKTDKQSAFDVTRLKNQFKIVKNPELVLSIITSNHATFTQKDIAMVLNRYIDDPHQFRALYDRLTNSKELVLLDKGDASTGRKEAVYTTQSMLRLEMNLIRTAEGMATQQTHKVDPKIIEEVIAAQNLKLAKYGGLSADQVAAIRHMLSGDQISCVVGFAGAGKTTALEAAKEGWEKAGYTVIGLAPTGKAARNIEDSGIRSMTLHKFLKAQSQGRERITDKTVLVLDEAGMVDSRRMAELIYLIEKAGAKSVNMGDGSQLQAVEAGPAFRLLTDRIRPAVLETVVRQQVDWQREATQLFGKHQTRHALKLYQENGHFHTIKETRPDFRDRALLIEHFCLARQLSGRMWKEMIEGCKEELGPGSFDPETDYKIIEKHQDFDRFQTWKKTRQTVVKAIIADYANQEQNLEERGVDVKALSVLVTEYKANPIPSRPLFQEIEDTLRQMSYEHIVDTRIDTKQALVEAWAKDRQEKPEQSHLMLAFTNKDASSLNQAARVLMREQGIIQGWEYEFATQRIETDDFGRENRTDHTRAFAQGDRLLFTRNDNSLNVKNGTLGTILSLDQNKITVILDEKGSKGEEKIVSFSVNLYPFIDQGWATTIHKAQGATADHVKFLASFEEYRNLAYMGMSRHRYTLIVFASDLDFWRQEKIIDRLSRIQEKLSGFDYLDPESLLKQIKQDEGVLWHEKKLQEGRDLWNAVKVTAQSTVNQLLDRPKADKMSEGNYRSFDDSEEKRSSDLFKFRVALPAERAKFEAAAQGKYYEACEFFEFEQRHGRAPTPEDRPLIQLMGESLTHLAGRLYQEQALKDGTLPDPSDISKQAYQEFAARPQQEKALAERLSQEYGISSSIAHIMANLMLTQKDISGQEPTKVDEATALKLAEYAQERSGEITEGQNDHLTTFCIARELKEMQAHMARHEDMPSDNKLKEIQEKVYLETQEIKAQMHQEQQAQAQREQIIRHGMRM